MNFREKLEKYVKLDCEWVYGDDGKDNLIDIYSGIHWTADTMGKYNKKEKLISSYKVDNDLVSLSCWCDMSGFVYWVVKEEEPNYLSYFLELKKSPNQYTDSEISEIGDLITNAEDYFESVLL